MSTRLIALLSCLSLAGPVHAQVQKVSLSGAPLAGQSASQFSAAVPDPQLNWRDPQWLARQRESSRWRYQLGVEQQLRSPLQFGPQAAVREALWAGVSYDVTRRISGGVEAPLWQRDSGWASRMNFEKPKDAGMAGLRGAFSYRLSSQSKLTLKPQARRVMVAYSATW
ncbi:hypothetical protein [Pelomonas cellulosilytica]|uniref:Uncharacterized protein n=1 Tax=Pelomonas cellulosilytica TaxID=2906762 RepID=A0ABS8XRZ8_9BURK|nr:hypothetical protein [Pelomonas sp. P8]MCE4555484.1 hypothetical protein [Pelomonas sp. P8]